MPTRQQLLRCSLVVPVVVLALAAAGCGGNSESGSSAERWADRLCSAVSDWTDSVTGAAGTLQDSGISKDSLERAVDETKTATEMLVTDLEALGRPETEAGGQAEEALDDVVAAVRAGLEAIEDAFDDASDVAGVLSAVSVVSSTLATMDEQVSESFEALKKLDVGGELEQAFEDAESCESS